MPSGQAWRHSREHRMPTMVLGTLGDAGWGHHEGDAEWGHHERFKKRDVIDLVLVIWVIPATARCRAVPHYIISTKAYAVPAMAARPPALPCGAVRSPLTIDHPAPPCRTSPSLHKSRVPQSASQTGADPPSTPATHHWWPQRYHMHATWTTMQDSHATNGASHVSSMYPQPRVGPCLEVQPARLVDIKVLEG